MPAVSKQMLVYILKEWVSRAICLFPATIHSPWTQKKDTHSLYLQYFQQRLFLKFSEKGYKFKILTVMGT